jgi:hypothetical protein
MFWFKKKTAEIMRELVLTEKLDAKFGPILEDILDTANFRHVYQPKEIGGRYDVSRFLPPIISDGGFTDTRENDSGAFQLTPGAMIQALPLAPATHRGIYRFSLSYEYVARALTNDDTRAFRVLIQAVLKDFSKKIGLNDSDDTIGITRFQFNLPGPLNDRYFLEQANSTGFELRIWIYCVNLSKLSSK